MLPYWIQHVYWVVLNERNGGVIVGILLFSILASLVYAMFSACFVVVLELGGWEQANNNPMVFQGNQRQIL